MKKIFKIILLFTLTFNFLIFNSNLTRADNFEPSSYINTIYAVNLCGPGSSLTACVGPVVLGSTTAGTTFDLGSVAAGSSAGNMGNLSAAVPGTTYSFAQVVLSRAFTVTGQAAASGTRCRTETDNGFDVSNPSAVAGVSDTAAAESQVIGIPSGPTIPSNMIGTTSLTGLDGADNSSGNGNIADAEPRVKFRFALSAPITIKQGKLPTFTIAFDLSEALQFNTVGEGACVATPGPPNVTASFSN
jgi:hypothetical protein